MRKNFDVKKLNELKKRVAPFDYNAKPSGTLFIHLVDAIVSQQLSLKAAATIYGRFEALFDNHAPTPEAILKLSHVQLRSVGLSEAKARAMVDLSSKALEGIVPTDEEAHAMSDAELIERLTQVKGIGQWTVEMVLIFRYRRRDVWPVDDLAVQKGFRLLFPTAKFKQAKELAPLAQQFNGRRSELAWYCWRVIEEQRQQTVLGIPLTWQKHKLMLWVRDGKPVRLDLTRKAKKPSVRWPGEVRLSTLRKSYWQKQLVEILKRGQFTVELAGSAFDQRVWHQVAQIPWGETRTYTQIAEVLGVPKKTRAVMEACAHNPLRLLIPCHRVVSAKGLDGIGLRQALKEQLLAAEGVRFS